MRTRTLSRMPDVGWNISGASDFRPDLIIFFGAREVIAQPECVGDLQQAFPGAQIMGCSTGGQITGAQTGDHFGGHMSDDAVVATAIEFNDTRVGLFSCPVGDQDSGFECGKALAEALNQPGLAGIFVLSDGLNVNGSELAAGLNSVLGQKVPITGGLAGDGADFGATLVSANGLPVGNQVAAAGFYGSSIRFGHGSAGGWKVFGPRRVITRSSGNVLYGLNDEPALDLYEKYLGPEEAQKLPGSGLLFPLRISHPDNPENALVRTILAIDKENRSMTFAGDMPEGWAAHLMHASFDNLIEGAAEAARQAHTAHTPETEQLALMVSCIGRRLLMGQRISEEVEAACDQLGPQTSSIGFYSYGELCPQEQSGAADLHNQTMTITTISEAA